MQNPMLVTTSSSPLNVRAAPTTSAKVVKTLAKGLTVEVIEIRDGWAKISDGWASLTFLTPVIGGSAADEPRRALAGFGFRTDTAQRLRQATEDIQAALGLTVDGVYGPATTTAVNALVARSGRITEHFCLAEFACKCGGKYAACRRIRVTKGLLDRLEKTRAAHYPGGLTVVSGYRCLDHNRATSGSASQSRHLQGDACDISPVMTIAQAQKLGWPGIGYGASSKRVRHVDNRPRPVGPFVDGQ